MGLLHSFFNNTRKPKGALGRGMLASMNRGHAAVSDWGMEHFGGRAP